MLEAHTFAVPHLLSARGLHRVQHRCRREIAANVKHHLIAIRERLAQHRLHFFFGEGERKMASTVVE